jgi:signal transduction histidine kinase
MDPTVRNDPAGRIPPVSEIGVPPWEGRRIVPLGRDLAAMNNTATATVPTMRRLREAIVDLLSTRQGWVAAALVLVLAALGQLVALSDDHLEELYPAVIAMAGPVAFFLVNAATPFDGSEAGTSNFLLLVLVTAALGYGALLRSRRIVVDERDATLQAHSETLRERALLEERTRIARELHDVVAHHISAIAIEA